MNRIPVCGKCLKTACYCGLVSCEIQDDTPDVALLKTETEIKAIGKEKIMCALMYPDTIDKEWTKIRPLKREGKMFDMYFKEVK